MKHDVLGVLVDAVDYDTAVAAVLDAARSRRPFAATAIAVHGVVEAARDPVLRHRINHLDLVTPDGQPVRWALNVLHRTTLRERVYGPELTRRLVAAGEPLFLYGGTPELVERLRARLPGVVGAEPSRFAPVPTSELDALAARIRASGARIVLVGLGCPRQEVFVSAMRDRLDAPLLAVGAAFDYLAGTRREPPAWVQRSGLQWLWRLVGEPRRLWRRYLLLNPLYLVLVALQRLGLRRFPTDGTPPDADAPIPA